MHDLDIRIEVHKRLVHEYELDPTTKIVDELALCQGISRIDIAVINGKIHGYEIKSDSDNLKRLPQQQEVYSKVLDQITIVANECHIDGIKDIVPDWWGISSVSEYEKAVIINQIRKPLDNQNVDSLSLAQLLWKDEILDILKLYNIEKGLKSKPRYYLWEFLACNISKEDLSLHVRTKLKSRANWRSD